MRNVLLSYIIIYRAYTPREGIRKLFSEALKKVSKKRALEVGPVRKELFCGFPHTFKHTSGAGASFIFKHSSAYVSPRVETGML